MKLTIFFTLSMLMSQAWAQTILPDQNNMDKIELDNLLNQIKECEEAFDFFSLPKTYDRGEGVADDSTSMIIRHKKRLENCKSELQKQIEKKHLDIPDISDVVSESEPKIQDDKGYNHFECHDGKFKPAVISISTGNKNKSGIVNDEVLIVRKPARIRTKLNLKTYNYNFGKDHNLSKKYNALFHNDPSTSPSGNCSLEKFLDGTFKSVCIINGYQYNYNCKKLNLLQFEDKDKSPKSSTASRNMSKKSILENKLKDKEDTKDTLKN